MKPLKDLRFGYQTHSFQMAKVGNRLERWISVIMLQRTLPCYIAYNFVIGAYSYWGPKAGYAIYHMSDAGMLFGGITVVCGIFGIVAGGFILDYMNSTISNAFKLLSGATFFGAIFCFSAFCSRNLYVFIALFSVGKLLVFATQTCFVLLHFSAQ